MSNSLNSNYPKQNHVTDLIENCERSKHIVTMYLNGFFWCYGPRLILLTALYMGFGPRSNSGVLAVHFNKALWNTCAFNVTVYWTVGTDFKTCLRLCHRWADCTAVSYMGRYHMCGFVKKEVDLATDLAGGQCVFVRKEDFNNEATEGYQCTHCTTNTSSITCNQQLESCEVQACPHLVVPHGYVYGNMRQVGARRRLVCYQNAMSSYPVCQPNGTWSDVLVCNEPTTTTVCPSGICDTTCASLHTATVITDGNLTLIRAPQLTHDHSEADLCCKEVGHELLRIDSTEKLARVVTLMNINGVDCLWVQGRGDGDERYYLEDGVRIPMTSAIWNTDTPDYNCVVMRSNYRLTDTRCSSNTCGYICEQTNRHTP